MYPSRQGMKKAFFMVANYICYYYYYRLKTPLGSKDFKTLHHFLSNKDRL